VKTPARILQRNAAWFPQYKPAHEIYCEYARSFLTSQSVAVHLGAGHDSLGVVGRLNCACHRVVSVDIDRTGLAQNHNPNRVQASGTSLPLKNGSADLVMADNVFEHLENPATVLAECNRVLKEKGTLVFLCPNGTSYIALVSRLTPHWLHAKFKRWFLGVAEDDTFPTYYRLNSKYAVTELANQAGFRVEVLESYVGWPTYWEFSGTLHRVFVAVHALLEKLPSWSHITLVGVLRAEQPDTRNNSSKVTEVTHG